MSSVSVFSLFLVPYTLCIYSLIFLAIFPLLYSLLYPNIGPQGSKTCFRVTRSDYLPRLISFAAGLFAYSHMDFDVDRNTNDTGDPSLAEMAIKALRILANNPEGYFLFVEGKSEVTTSERKSHLQLCTWRRKE